MAVGERTVTIVGGDFLLFVPSLRDAVLHRAKLPPRDVLFTSSHTHAGPGGYAGGMIERIALGAYNPDVRQRLVEAFAGVILDSRRNLA